MTEFLKKMMERSTTEPPERCLESFQLAFNNAINPEWTLTDGIYESVFYQDKLEHIARFDSSGRLLDHKMFLPETMLPGKIRKQLTRKGEIMIAVLINKVNCIEYEVVIRDPELNRSQMTFSQTGTLLLDRKF